MGLSASLSNALSGMSTSQSSLQVLSRNVANAGTPGYHRQSLSVIDTKGVNSIYARSGGVERAFNQSLQANYTSATSDAGYADIRASVLDRLQTYFGKPGSAASLDSMFAAFQKELQGLTSSTDNYASRANVVAQAQALAATLNAMSQSVQGLRQETEVQMASSVDALNDAIGSLQQINARLAVQNQDEGSRAALMDQRDRLVSQIAEHVDVNVDYRGDGTVALMTRTGVGILDVKAAVFGFEPAGMLSADKQFNANSDRNGVGKLTLTTSAGLTIDLVQQRVLQSGRLAGLIELRDSTLVAAQSQLDEIAGGLAKAFSTVTTPGEAARSGLQNGYVLDLGNLRDGNDFVLTYSVGGVEKTLRVVNTKQALDYLDATGARVVGVDFAGGASSVASRLASTLGPGFTLSGAGNLLTVLDDGAGGNTDIGGLVGHATASGVQNGDLALNLFVDRGNGDFTDSLDGRGQKLGFAARIAVNSAVLADPTLLVRYEPGGSLGDAARANTLLDQLRGMSFATPLTSLSEPGSFRLGGTVSDLISQTMNFVGGVAARALSADDTQKLTMDTLTQRLSSEYGVNIDEEMARLMELQNAYAANSRIISVVQDLMNKLMQL